MRLKMMAGGDAVDYDSLTAPATEVTEGLIFLGKDSDEPQTGTLPNMEKMQKGTGYSAARPKIPVHTADRVGTTVDTAGKRRIVLSPPRGRWAGYDTAYVGCLPEDLGIVEDVVANKFVVGGVAGTYGADGNLTADYLKAGLVGYGVDGRVAGAAADYGSVLKTLAAGEEYEVKKGFYGAGRIAAKDLESQTDGTALAKHILDGFIAWVKGLKVTGTMPNHGAVSKALGVDESYTIPEGYHDGAGVVEQGIVNRGKLTVPAVYSDNMEIDAGYYDSIDTTQCFKAGQDKLIETMKVSSSQTRNAWGTFTATQDCIIIMAGTAEAGSCGVHATTPGGCPDDSGDTGAQTNISTDGELISYRSLNAQVKAGMLNFALNAKLKAGQHVYVSGRTWGNQSLNTGAVSWTYSLLTYTAV